MDYVAEMNQRRHFELIHVSGTQILKGRRYGAIGIGIECDGRDNGIFATLVILVTITLCGFFSQFTEGSANLLDRFALVALFCTYGTVHLCFETTLLSVFKKA